MIPPNPKRRHIRLICALGALVGVLATFRAMTQSLTHDEAMTFHFFQRHAPAGLLDHYVANHHVLHTWLAWVFTNFLGFTEFSLRLPALIGCFLFVAVAYRLITQLALPSMLDFVALALLATCPFVADYFVAARGYGLANAFALCFLVSTLAALGDPDATGWKTRRRWIIGGVFLGLCLGANLTYAWLALGTGLGIILAVALPWPGLRRFGVRCSRLAAFLVLPATVVTAAIVAAPLSHAKSSNFFVGVVTLRASLSNLVEKCVAYDPGRLTELGLDHDIVSRAAVAALPWIAGWIALAVLCSIIALARGVGESRDRFLVVVGLATLIAPFLFPLTQLMQDMDDLPTRIKVDPEIRARLKPTTFYPSGRTGLFWVLLFLVSLISTTERLLARRVLRPMGFAGAALMTVLALWFVAQVQWTHFNEWRYDSNTRTIFEDLHRRHDDLDLGRPLVVGAHWFYAPTLNAYHSMHDAGTWLRWIPRETRPDRVCDYYVLRRGWDNDLIDLFIDVVAEYPESGTVVGVLRVRPAGVGPPQTPKPGSDSSDETGR